LLRRLRAHLARARHDWSPDVPADQHAARYPTLLNVGTSATIKSVYDPALSADERRQRRDAAVQEFFSRLTGETPDTIRVIGEVLEDITVPTEAVFAAIVPTIEPVDVTNTVSVERALSASAGIAPTGKLASAARHCRLLWLLNQWLVAHPMSAGQLVQRLLDGVPERHGANPDALTREVEAVLLAGSALPDGTPGGLRLRAHCLIRGGWQFVRCVDSACGRIYPMGQPVCECGRSTAPLFLCRNCGADYLRLSGDPASGQMRPYDQNANDEEWMLYDVTRQEADIEPEEDLEDSENAPRRPRSGRSRIETVRGHPVYHGSFDPRTLNFSVNGSDFPFQVRLVHGRTRCLCCGGSAGSRNAITPVSLGTSAAIKVLSEGLVEALADANTDREDHDGKERLLIFSDSRQDAAHRLDPARGVRRGESQRPERKIRIGSGERTFGRRDEPHRPGEPLRRRGLPGLHFRPLGPRTRQSFARADDIRR
jgi:hypothetical protein